MAAFPTVYPDSISFDHGQPQVSEYNAFGIGPIRFRNNNFINAQVFTLEYRFLQQTSVDLIRDHYIQSQGTADEFTVPIGILGSVGVTDATSLYRYVETPQEEHFGVYFNLTVTLQAVQGIEMAFGLDAGGTTLPSEESVSEFVFEGTAPFILNGSIASEATLILDGNV